MRVIIDTNIVYYLCDITSNEFFLKTKFLEDSKKIEIGITYYSLFEILNRYILNKDKQNLKKILNYLKTNKFGIVFDKRLNVSDYKVFDKCLSNSKRRYYRKKFRIQLIEYIANFISEYTMIFSAFWLSIKSYNEKKYIEAFFKSKSYLVSNFRIIFNMVNENIKKALNAYFNSTDIKNKKKFLKQELDTIILNSFKLNKKIYNTYKDLDDFENLIDIDIEKINNAEINKDSLKGIAKEFSMLRNKRDFGLFFETLFNGLFPSKEHDMRYDVIKFIIKKMISDGKFEFNDVVDYLNLITPELLKEEKSKTYYLTMENKWILFLEENKSKSQYYKNNYDFIKNYYSQK